LLQNVQIGWRLPLLQVQAVGLGLDQQLLESTLSFKGLSAETWRPSVKGEDEQRMTDALYTVKLCSGPVQVGCFRTSGIF
jgi:hypothetical protein